MSDIKLIQYYALYSIFEATNAKPNDFIITSRTFGDDLSDIPEWKTTTGWLDTNLDPCADSWYGVSCNNDQVVSLDLFDNGLTGNFAPEVKLLAGVKEKACPTKGLGLILPPRFSDLPKTLNL